MWDPHHGQVGMTVDDGRDVPENKWAINSSLYFTAVESTLMRTVILTTPVSFFSQGPISVKLYWNWLTSVVVASFTSIVGNGL